MDHNFEINRFDDPRALQFIYNLKCLYCGCSGNIIVQLSAIKQHCNKHPNSFINGFVQKLINEKIKKLPKTCNEYYMIEVME